MKAAFQAANQRMWSEVRPECMRAMGIDTATAEKMGLHTCLAMTVRDGKGVDLGKVLHDVDLIQAGDLPPPGPNDVVPAAERILLDLTQEGSAIQADIAKTLGPEDAHRAYENWNCWSSSVWTQ